MTMSLSIRLLRIGKRRGIRELDNRRLRRNQRRLGRAALRPLGVDQLLLATMVKGKGRTKLELLRITLALSLGLDAVITDRFALVALDAAFAAG